MIRILSAALTVLAFVAPANAQLTPSSDEPVDITGETAELQDNVATWSGDVRVVQGEAILTTSRLIAELDDEGDFKTIRAEGAVRYSNGDEAITGERAVYDAASRTITITENVIVTQGRQVMAAGKVIYWVDTGRVRFAPAPGGRIRGVFYTKSVGQQL
ncbi:MAG: LptA/OstA family protein [Parvularculaceae bacterium]